MFHAGDDPGHPSRMDGDDQSDSISTGSRERSAPQNGKQWCWIQAYTQHQVTAIHIRDCTESDGDGKEHCQGKC